MIQIVCARPVTGVIVELTTNYRVASIIKLKEMDPEELHTLMMNPNNRILVRFTIEDAERLSDALDDLLSENKTNVRKKLVQESSITVDDIDN